jgi:hypothetical protein
LGRARPAPRAGGGPVHAGEGIGQQALPFDEPRAEAREAGLATPEGVDRQIRRGHVVHPRLNHGVREIAHPREPAGTRLHEGEKLRQVPPIRRNPPFGSPPLFPLVLTELLDEFD